MCISIQMLLQLLKSMLLLCYINDGGRELWVRKIHQFHSQKTFCFKHEPEKQLRFLSTKKKALEKRFAKATGDEKENCLVRLDDVEVRFCALCMSEDVSDMTGNINVSWTQCSTCGIWLHDEFCCKNCVLHTTFYEVFLISLKYKQKLE